MRSCFSKDSKLTIIDEIKTIVKKIDEVLLGDVFNYLSPSGYNTYMIDTKYNVPLIEINFDGWFETSVRLWLNLKRLDQSLFCWKEHHLAHHLFLRFLQLMIVVTILFFSEKMAQKQIIYGCDKLPQPATKL